MLELFTGSDTFGEVENAEGGRPDRAGVPVRDHADASTASRSIDPKLTCDVALKLPTFTATAEMAGISRVMGGYHIQADNVAGLELGRKVAQYTWPRIRKYIEGTATPR